MLKNIYIENFKCFKKIHLELSKLNVLSGINSMGKSTIIQSLLLIRQAYENNCIDKYLQLNGDLISLGTGYDVLNRNSNDEFIKFAIDYDDKLFNWVYTYEKDSSIQKLKNNEVFPLENFKKMNIFSDKFEYISADRIGPRRYYMADDSDRSVNRIGYRGEYFPNYLQKNKYENVKNKNIIHRKCGNNEIIYQFEAWMSELSPGIKIHPKEYIDAGIVGIGYDVYGAEHKPLNVGFGLSYTAPIVLSLLKASEGDLIILENPEAHLHPRGQRLLGELISKACAGGVQIILETHSDHVLNGIRLSVKHKVIDKNDVRLNFFYQDIKDNNSTIKYCKTSPSILDDGSISGWPDGFFDEWDKALEDLIKVDETYEVCTE